MSKLNSVETQLYLLVVEIVPINVFSKQMRFLSSSWSKMKPTKVIGAKLDIAWDYRNCKYAEQIILDPSPDLNLRKNENDRGLRLHW